MIINLRRRKRRQKPFPLDIRGGKVRFRLRTLLLVFTLISIALAAFVWWDTHSRALIQWIDPSAPEAATIYAQPQVTRTNELISAQFFPHYRDAYDVFFSYGNKWSVHSDREPSTVNNVYQGIRVGSPDESKINLALDIWQKADTLQDGRMVVHGIVATHDGMPIADAAIDLLGPVPRRRQCFSRRDGTFSMPMKLRSGKSFALSVSYEGKTAVSRAFEIAVGRRELVARITVP